MFPNDYEGVTAVGPTVKQKQEESTATLVTDNSNENKKTFLMNLQDFDLCFDINADFNRAEYNNNDRLLQNIKESAKDQKIIISERTYIKKTYYLLHKKTKERIDLVNTSLKEDFKRKT